VSLLLVAAYCRRPDDTIKVFCYRALRVRQAQPSFRRQPFAYGQFRALHLTIAIAEGRFVGRTADRIQED